MRASASVLGLVFAGACYTPHPPSGVACASDRTCPAGLTCSVDNRCVEPGLGDDAVTVIDTPFVDDGLPDMATMMPDAFVAPFAPSNGVDPALVGGAGNLDITTSAVFDTHDATVTVAGVATPVTVQQVAGYTVFAFGTFHVASGATLALVGDRPAVILVAGDATIDGTVDGSGGCRGTTDPTCAGPGGGVGTVATIAAGGCSPGKAGQTLGPTDNSDGGGGGGGGGGKGGRGGNAGSASGGEGGNQCMPQKLVPIIGGSGGTGGGIGTTTASRGGGGGGALQLTAFGTATVNGTIRMAGAGGEGGFGDPTSAGNGSAGAGGGAGGGVLIEAMQVAFGASSVVAANGGGGGGSAYADKSGFPGASGLASSTPAKGGLPADPTNSNTPGGDGAAGGTMAGNAVAGNSSNNGGGGGGGVGVIYLRAHTFAFGGLKSPNPTTNTF